MKLTTGLIIVILAMVFFYVRIAILRGRKKRMEREFALKRRRVKGRSKGAALPQKAPGTPPYSISSWFLVGVAILLMLVGLVVYNKISIFGWEIIKDPALVDMYDKFWYIPVALGVVVFAFCFKIDKPLEDE